MAVKALVSMHEEVTLLRFLVAILIFLGIPPSVLGGNKDCSGSIERINPIQILLSTYDAGTTITDGFILTSAGTLKHASWNDQNILVGLADSVYLGAAAYRDALESLATIQMPTSETAEHDISPSPPVLTAELVIPCSAGNHYLVFTDELPAPFTRLIDNWRSIALLHTAKPGQYLWAVSAPDNLSVPDITISGKERRDILATEVAAIFSSDAVVVPSSHDYRSFLTGGRKYRSRFVARLKSGFAYFGILTAK